MDEKTVTKIGWIASFLAIAMFFSYIDQIILNISGTKGSVILPAVTTVNCIAWMLYGWFKEKKDWPIVFCNIPGIFFGAVTTVTAIL